MPTWCFRVLRAAKQVFVNRSVVHFEDYGKLIRIEFGMERFGKVFVKETNLIQFVSE
jgi:hypothetical protein